MKRVILASIVLLILSSTVFSQDPLAMARCNTKASFNSAKALYEAIKSEKPYYQPIIEALEKKVNDPNFDFLSNAEEISGVLTLLIGIVGKSNPTAMMTIHKKLEKDMAMCRYE